MEKKLLILPGYLVGCGGLALITYRTVLALATSSKTITVQVNRFGEQYVDLVALGFLWVVCVVGLWSLSQLIQQQQRTAVTHESRLPTPQGGVLPILDEALLADRVGLKGSFPVDAMGYSSMELDVDSSAAFVSVLVRQDCLFKDH